VIGRSCRHRGRLASMIDRGVSRRPHEVAFRHVDVFSAAPLGGNGLGVVMLDEPLDAPLMLAITRELRQFETIFLDGIDDDGASAQVFTPAPTVCSATAGPAVSPPHPNAAPSPRETADVVSPPAINRRTGAGASRGPLGTGREHRHRQHGSRLRFPP